MSRKKNNNQEEENTEKKISNKKVKSTDEDSSLEEFPLVDDDFVEDDILGEIDEEDEEQEVMSHVKEYEKDHKAKLVNVYNKIGKPKFKLPDEFKDEDSLKDEYKKFIILLDDHNIIVHFKNDYPIKEKYRFITDEVFNQDVEDLKKTNIHINFVYEDFHPEKDMDDDDDEDFY